MFSSKKAFLKQMSLYLLTPQSFYIKGNFVYLKHTKYITFSCFIIHILLIFTSKDEEMYKCA